MFHDSLDTSAADRAECPVRRDLTLLAATLDTRFLQAGTTLADAIAMVDRIIGGLDTIVEALDETSAGAAAADLVHVAGRIAALPGTLAERTARMTEIAGIARALREHVMEMHRALRVLGIYGMNIKIAASGEERFVGFVDGMNGRLASGEGLLLGVIAKLKELETGLGGVQQVDRLLAAECARVVPAVPDQLAADGAELNGHLRAVATLARRVAATARSIQAKVAVLLGALQVGDSTRQRLEHVVSALQMVEALGCGPSAAAHVDRLLAAQLTAIVQDFARETAALVASLEGLDPDACALRELIAEQGGEDGRGFLTRLDASVTGMDRVIVQLQSAHAQARGMTMLMATTVTDLTQRVDQLGAIRLDVQDIATNTRLLCRRHGHVGRAVSVVATEVDAHARDLGVTTNAVAGTIRRLGAVGPALSDAAGERDIGGVLKGALDVIREACQRTERVVLQGGDDADRLVELVRATATDLTRELALSGQMEQAAAFLSARAGAFPAVDEGEDDALRAALVAIARTYTMASEREVHAPFLRPGMEMAAAAPPPPAGDEDDDDDGLF